MFNYVTVLDFIKHSSKSDLRHCKRLKNLTPAIINLQLETCRTDFSRVFSLLPIFLSIRDFWFIVNLWQNRERRHLFMPVLNYRCFHAAYLSHTF